MGELSCKERSDEAGQFVGKRAGSTAAVAQEGAKRRPEATAKALRPSSVHRRRNQDQNNSGRPQAARLVLARSCC